jgi:hypothetical protein
LELAVGVVGCHCLFYFFGGWGMCWFWNQGQW